MRLAKKIALKIVPLEKKLGAPFGLPPEALTKMYFARAGNEISGKCFLLGPSVCFLSHVLNVVLLTYILKPQFPPNPSLELITYTSLVTYSLLLKDCQHRVSLSL